MTQDHMVKHCWIIELNSLIVTVNHLSKPSKGQVQRKTYLVEAITISEITED